MTNHLGADDLWHEERMLIDGELASARSGAVYDNINPATEQIIGVAANGSVSDMDAAIGAARVAFDETSWSRDLSFRVRCLRQLADAMTGHVEAFRATTVAEVGAPISLTSGPQLETPIEGIKWVADLAESYAWTEDLGVARPFGIASKRTVFHEAAGVVGAITPWNFPTQINLAKLAPALAAGCTVVLKPAPDTPWMASLLGRLAAEETDIPPGVFNVVTSAGHEVGQMLSDDPRVDLVSFTGSTATGRTVMASAAATLKRVFLELGGKSAAVVLADADVAEAAGATAFQLMTHAGQGCAITTRLVLPRERLDEGIEAAIAMMQALTYGDPTDPGNMMGPLISERQRKSVLGFIDTGVREGASVVLGGGIPKDLPVGYFVEPTILVVADTGATVAQCEIFGPVLVVLAHDGDDDAVAIANNSMFGLSGAVFGSPDRAHAVARRIRTGTVSVNGGLWYGPDVPFGGFKQSGIGREMGRQGFEEYLETKSVAEPA
ncbi:MAG: aldehyde dehydrogenase [Actinomycetes bacterium]